MLWKFFYSWRGLETDNRWTAIQREETHVTAELFLKCDAAPRIPQVKSCSWVLLGKMLEVDTVTRSDAAFLVFIAHR